MITSKINPKFLATLSLGLLVAACAQPYQQQAAAPYGTPYYPAQSNNQRALSMSAQNCIDYGFTSPSANYDRCVQREMRSREQGRVARDYDQNRLVQDANAACYDYGIERQSQRGIVDIETLEKTNADMIGAIRGVLAVQQEGRAKRLDAERRMETMNGALRTALVESGRT